MPDESRPKADFKFDTNEAIRRASAMLENEQRQREAVQLRMKPFLALQEGSETDEAVLKVIGWSLDKFWLFPSDLRKYRPAASTNINDAIAALQCLQTWDKRSPIWWVTQFLPGRPEDEQYTCLCEGIREHIFAPTLPLAICRAILWRESEKAYFVQGAWRG